MANRHPERSEGSPPTRSFAVSAAQDDVFVVTLWAAAIALTRPHGNFPRHDDWDFAIATWRFARTGHFSFTDFTAVSLRAQVLWGALWTRLFGESFDVLRASTLVLAALTLVVVHRTLAHAGAPRFARIAGALALGFHPIFAWSSVTYMTEVPFVFASSVALYFLVRAAREERVGFVAAACIAIAVAWFVRQTGVTHVMAALAVVLLFRERLTARWRFWAAALGATLAVFVALLLFKVEWISGAPGEFANHFMMWRESSFRLPQQIAIAYHWGDFNARNSALFFLPLVVPLAFFFPRRRAAVIATAVIAILLFARTQSLIGSHLPMPYIIGPFCCDVFGGYIFSNLGLGPFTLRAGPQTYPFQLAMPARLGVTYLTVVAGALLVAFCIVALLRAARAPRENAGFLLALSFALFGSLALLGSGLYVDRYALDSAWALAVALPLGIRWTSRGMRVATIATLAAVALFDVAAIHDDLAWNRARWTALHDLRARGVPLTDIDAGEEAWYFYELSQRDRAERRRHMFGQPERLYTVAFAPLPRRTPVAAYRYRSWIALGREGAVYVLRATSS